MESMGYAGVVLLMFLENVFPPIPSELVMPLAGFASARGDLTLPGVVAAGTLGSVLGAIPLYWVGRAVSLARLERIADRRGKWLGVSGKDVRKADGWLDRHGSKTVLFGRVIPGIRSLISIPAGASVMPPPRFLLFTAIGSLAWVTVLGLLGRALGEHYDAVGKYLGPAGAIVLAAIAVAAVVLVLRKRAARDNPR